MRWQFVRMPKCATTSIAQWCERVGLEPTRGHTPARDLLRPSVHLFGSYRPPTDWYRSWYGHAVRWAGKRVDATLRHYGQGSRDFPDVLYGLTHLDEVGPLPFYDHLLAVPASGRGYWSSNVRHFLCDGDAYLVDAMVRVGPSLPGELEALTGCRGELAHENRTGAYADLAYTPEMLGWVWDADAEVYAELLQTFGGGR